MVLLMGAEGMRLESEEEGGKGQEKKEEKGKFGNAFVHFGGCTRILPGFPLWPMATTLDLIYCVCSTSCLFHYVFSVACWSSIPIISLFQFPIAGKILRKQLRKMLLLKTFGLQFIDDRIGIFDIPGLEIDTDVDGLMVIRGATIRLSNMSLRAHGVEVGLSIVMGERVRKGKK